MPGGSLEQPPGGGTARTPPAGGSNNSAAPGAGEKNSSSEEAPIIYAHRLGCVLHILHISITAGFTSVFFMGPLGKGSWHEWGTSHVFSLLGMVWYNTSRSNSSNTNFLRWQKLVADEFPAAKPWTKKFIKPAETRWMVVMDGAKILFERWDEVPWLLGEWAACNIGKTAYRNYWLKSAVALQDPLMLVQVMFAARLGELVFDWAYNWIRGKGGFFLKGEGVGRRLFPGMRLVEVADFSRLLLQKVETIRKEPKTYFRVLLERVDDGSLSEAEKKHFMVNFSEDRVFFAEFNMRWKKWMQRHQELPLSMARIGCPSFYARMGIMGKGAVEQAVGPEYARAFLHVGWPERYEGEPRSEREREYRVQLGEDFGGVIDARRKDELTFGLFSIVEEDAEMRCEVEGYAESGFGDKEVDEEAEKGTTALVRLFEKFPRLYKFVCVRFYFVPIHQQLIEAFFSKYDTCAKKTDVAVMDSVRVGSWQTEESRDISSSGATGSEIRAAGTRRLAGWRKAKAAALAEHPAGNAKRKRVLDTETGRAMVEELKREGGLPTRSGVHADQT